LQPPIASTVRVVSVATPSTSTSIGVKLLQLAPSGQHLVLAPKTGDPQLWHVMSNSKVHTFKGHSGVILCMCVTRESQYLLTGSEDTTVIVWDLHTLAIKTKILEHIAPVLCVAAIVNRSLVISGGEDSAVIVTSLVDGALVHAMEITDDNVFLVTLQTENEL
ncbi:putative WD repeat-containing protein, partial [Operophtera brumata]